MRAWLQAARPLAQVNIALPLLVGEMLAFAATGRLSVALLLVAHVVGVLLQLFIVFANDVADEAGDRLNRTYTIFSGGSRVLPEGKLVAAQLRRAALSMGALVVGVSAVSAAWLQRPLFVPAAGVAIILSWAYSFPPLRLSYAGWGEATQGVGLGVVLPLLGWYAQAGTLQGFPWLALAPLFLLGFAGNITTALSDHPADVQAGKATWPVRYGQRRARKHSIQLLAIAALLTPLVLPQASRSVWLAVELAPLVVLLANLRCLGTADAESPAAPRRFMVHNGAAQVLTLLGWIAALALHAR